MPLLSGGTYRLADRRPRLFTMVVFFRGLHCPVCRAQLSELDRRLAELEERGIDVITVSGETLERTTKLAQEWNLEHLPFAYGLTEDQMRAWGLFISRGINERRAGAIQRTRPVSDLTGSHRVLRVGPLDARRTSRLDDLLGGIDYWTTHDYPARGEA